MSHPYSAPAVCPHASPRCKGPSGNKFLLCDKCKKEAEAPSDALKPPSAIQAELARLAAPDPPATITGPLFRGEKGEAEVGGRSPAALRAQGGFSPWQITSIQTARSTLTSLATINCGFAASGLLQKSLQGHAYAWQKGKDKVDGFFVSTGNNARESYDNYINFYRINIPTLTRRDWAAVGLVVANDEKNQEIFRKNTEDLSLYTDKPLLADSDCIAILCLTEKSRVYEVLVMTPMGPALVERRDRKTGQWTGLKDVGDE